MPERKKKLGEILLEAGVISKEQLNAALEDQKRYGGRLGTILVERRLISESDFFKALSSQLKIPAVDFSKSVIPESVIHLISKETQEKHIIFPVATRRTPSGNVIIIAMADPTNVEVQDEIRFQTGYRVEPVLALESVLRQIIREYWYDQNGKGSYHYKPDVVDLKATGEKSRDEELLYSATHRMISFEDAQEKAQDKEEVIPAFEQEGSPRFTRELKALLKLLYRKGLITHKEFLEEFKKTR